MGSKLYFTVLYKAHTQILFSGHQLSMDNHLLFMGIKLSWEFSAVPALHSHEESQPLHWSKYLLEGQMLLCKDFTENKEKLT